MTAEWHPVPGQSVVYRPHPSARAEDGTVLRDAGPGTVFVLFVGDCTPKATRIADLALAFAEPTP